MKLEAKELGHHVKHSRWSQLANCSAKILKVASEGQSQLGSVWGRAECNEVTDDCFVGRSGLESRKKFPEHLPKEDYLTNIFRKEKLQQPLTGTNWD